MLERFSSGKDIGSKMKGLETCRLRSSRHLITGCMVMAVIFLAYSHGTIEENEVSLVKQYIEGHILLYQGRKPVGNVMTGKWIMAESQEDAFYFERLSGSLERPQATAYLQEWRWQQESVGTEYIVDLVFTNEGKLYGAGTDDIGSFAVLGNHCSNGESVAVSFLKQYEGIVANYEGVIRKREKDMVMKGMWTSEEGKCNSFMMTTLNAVPAQETF